MSVSRAVLVERLHGTTRPVVVLSADAGMGKTVLLDLLKRRSDEVAGSGVVYLDAGTALSLDVIMPPPDGTQLVVAMRPGCRVPGLARARLYGLVEDVDNDALTLTVDDIAASLGIAPLEAKAVHRVTGGWPCLLERRGRGDAKGEVNGDDAVLISFLIEEILMPLTPETLVAGRVLLRDNLRPDPAALRDFPFTTADRGDLHPILVACRAAMLRAITLILDEQATRPARRRRIEAAQIALGDTLAAIASAQSTGDFDAALFLVEAAGADYIIHRYGSEALDDIILGFPSHLTTSAPALVNCRAMRAVKRGDVTLALRIVHDRWGIRADDPKDASIPVSVRFFRLMLRGWEDFEMRPEQLDAGYVMLDELGPDDDLRRGSLYNSILEVYIRSRRFAEADHAANLAEGYYARAGIPILSFYIALHRAMIRLLQSDPSGAAGFAAMAHIHLSRCGFESLNDARLLSMLEACIAYEQGSPAALTRFISLDLEDLAQGEIWPSLVDLLIQYGSQALSEQMATMAARSFLDHWRIFERRSDAFVRRIDIREAIILQNASRWLEAARQATTLGSSVDVVAVVNQGAALAWLYDRDDLALALFWLRQCAHDAPGTQGLEAALDAVLANQRLTQRQRFGAELWRAEVLRRARRLNEAQAQALRTLQTAARLGAVASISEERPFVAALLGSRRMRSALEASAPVRRLLRRTALSIPERMRQGRTFGLTRQESRMLHGLSEGATNKAMANAMGLSEATVKFHLRNLYAKLGCRSRSEAVRTAAAMGLIA